MRKHFRLSRNLILSLSLFTVFLLLPNKVYAGCTESNTSGNYVCVDVSNLGCRNVTCSGSTCYWYLYTLENYSCADPSEVYIFQRSWECDPGSTPDACSGGGGSCFTGDTKISTPDGEKEIKDIKEGDVVKSFDPNTGEITESTVTNPYSKVSDHIYTITTSDGRVVKTTGEHPFYVGTESDQLPITNKYKS